MSDQESEQITVESDGIDDAAPADADTASTGTQPSQSDPYDFDEFADASGAVTPKDPPDDDADASSGAVDDATGSDAEGESTDDNPRGDAEPKPPEIPADLLQEAESLGFLPEEIAAFGGAEPLARALTVLNRQLAGRSRPTDTSAPIQQPPQTEPPKPEAQAGDVMDLPELDMDEVDPALGRYLQALTKEVQELRQLKSLNGLTDEMAQVREFVQKQQADAFEQQFNGFIDQLGEPWADVFGTKVGDAAVTTAKKELINQAHALAIGYEAKAIPLPPVDQLLNRALRSLHGDRTDKLVRQELNGKLAKRSQQGIARASNRDATELDPNRRAVKAVAEFIRERGGDPGAGYAEDEL